MNKPTYETITIDVSADAAGGLADGQQRPAIAIGRGISSILVRRIDPISQQINLHFGPSGDGMPVYQGEVFGEDHVGPVFDAGVQYSYNGAPAAGTVLVLTVFYAGPSA